MNTTPGPRGKGATLLIIDDTPANVGVLASYFDSHGFSVMVAQDGAEGVERAQYARPDLILLDVMMPGVDGFEACRRLKANAETRDIPVIFMTALSDTHDKVTGFALGGVDYVTKPFQVEEVLARVNTHLALQAMRRQLAAQNRQLQQEIAVRQRFETELQHARDELEDRVAQRTAELASANDRLRAENLERGRVEEALRRSEAQLRRLIESNIIGVFFWDIGGGVNAANDAFLHIIGYTREDLSAGRLRWNELTPPEYRPTVERALAELRQSGTCTPYEKELTAKDGRRVPVLVGLALFEGSQERGVGFVVDLSERQARLSAEAASRAKSTFLATMSHELRSPLNTILGFTRLLIHQPGVPEGVRDDLVLVWKAGEHLRDLINDVLDLSKLEAGRATVNAADFDLEFLLDELKDMLTPAAVAKRLELVFSPRPEVPRFVRCDPLKLRQILTNLIGNAIKFTGQGRIVVNVEPQPADSAGSERRLAFSVADTGAGIAPEELDSLFNAFAQAEAGRCAQEGTGLGLVISRGLVRLLGGEMRIDSQVGAGTTVRFDLPVRVVAAPSPAEPPRHEVVGLVPGQPQQRILVVDDQAAGRQLLVRLLAPLGFAVREAAGGQQAIEVWRQWQPHLIWMDLRMPVLDGREATRRIRALEAGGTGGAGGAGPRTVIVALTASSFEEERDDVIAAGCDDFLRKPFRESELFALMEKHLGVRFATQAAGKAAVPAPDPAALAALPDEARSELEHALLRLDPAAVERAIEAVGAYDAGLAESLAALAHDFEYNRILAVLPGDRLES